MKKSYTIRPDCLCPPEQNRELALFTCAIQSPVTESALRRLGIEVSETFNIVSNHAGDDPPDIEALGLGWECTEFPPNQSALAAVHKERKCRWMQIPPISETGRKIQKIRELAEPRKTMPKFYANDEIGVLEEIFLKEVIGGAKSKDLPGNDILLLDNRDSLRGDSAPEEAVIKAVIKSPPKHIKVILLVRWRRKELVPWVVQVFPVATKDDRRNNA